MSATPFRMTFGVELEFIVNYSRDDYNQNDLLAGDGTLWPAEISPTLHHKYGILVRLKMIQLLQENGFSTNAYNCHDFSKWTVATDGTVAPDDVSESWYAIELKTPVLDCARHSWEQVEMVVQLLVSNFRLYVNETCGLHVHVGNGNRGFDLRTLKNFGSLIAVFERQLNSLHPPDRLDTKYAKPVGMLFDPEASPMDKLVTINELDTLKELIIFFHCMDDECEDYDKYMAFNFLNLQETLDEPFRTIEFRQHQGTLDPKMITNWIMVACNLVRLSHTDGATLGDLVRKHIYNTEYTIMDLFHDLDLSDLADFYAPLVLQYATGEDPALMAVYES